MVVDLDFIRELVAKGGPETADYTSFDQWISNTSAAISRGALSNETLLAVQNVFGEVLTPATNYGHIYRKPHGYAGDFEIIDRIYQRYISSNEALAAWDIHFHTRSGPDAVRNRKDYFHQLLKKKLHANGPHPLRVLNVASGPARDIAEFYGAGALTVTCIEQDQKAIDYARNLCNGHGQSVHFVRENALKYKPREQFDLIWSAGLFDYFADPLFVRVLARLAKSLAPNGELVIGNFSEDNPDRDFMRFFGWDLIHRSQSRLLELAERAGLATDLCSIGKESHGINLFLHYRFDQ